MEDGVLDLVIGERALGAVRSGSTSRPSTLVAGHHPGGAAGQPMRDRIGIPLRLEFYTPEEQTRVLLGRRQKLGRGLHPQRAPPRSRARARGQRRAVAGRAAPRARARLPRRGEVIDRKRAAMRWRARGGRAGAGRLGPALSPRLIENYGGGPPGVETLAAATPRRATPWRT
jgi:Holliday junction DNA helicase RuvB